MTQQLAQCLLVAQVLVADGIVTDEEREFLNDLMTQLELTDDERRAVADLEGVEAAEKLLRGLPAPDRENVLEMLIDAAGADGKLGARELSVVQKVSAALGLHA